MDSQNNLNKDGTLKLIMPTCSLESFAVANGVTKEVVKGWVKNNYIPTLKLGRYRVINLAKLTLQLM